MWLRLWSHARIDLGLSDREFWSITPRQLSYLDKRWKAQQEREEYYTGLLASVVANCQFNPPKEPFAPSDFMPSHRAKARAELSDDELAVQIHAALRPRSLPRTKG